MRINQLGYLPSGPKHAVWVSERREPAAFRVLDRAGGAGLPGPHAAVAGAARADVRAGRAHARLLGPGGGGGGLRDRGDGARSHPFAVAADLYRGLARDALTLLLPPALRDRDRRGPGTGLRRPAGHLGDRSVAAWTGPDAERLYPGWSCPGRFDVSGGWYDAGDHGKYVTSGAIPLWQLLATVELIRRRGARWAADRGAAARASAAGSSTGCCACRCRPASPHAGMAFHRVHGSEWQPLPCRPHEDPTERGPAPSFDRGHARSSRRPRRTARACSAASPAYAATGCSRPPSRGAGRGRRATCSWPPTTRARSAAARTTTTTSRTTARGPRPSCGSPPAGDCAATSPAGAHSDAFDLDGFDWNRVTAPAAIDLALHGRRRGRPRRRGRRSAARAAGRPALGPALRARRTAGTGARTGSCSTTSWCSRSPTS